MNKNLLIVFLLMLGILALNTGCSQVKATDEHAEKHSALTTTELEHDEFEDRILLSKSEIEEFGIQLGKVRSMVIEKEIYLPGEINLNNDMTARISSRVRGKAIRVLKGLGDFVKKGETLVVISSRELANAKAEYLASIERLKLAKTILEREKKLWEKQITSQREFLEARKNFTEAKISYTTIKQKLYSFGIKDQELKQLENDGDSDLTLYRIKAPFDGVVLKKNVSVGENVNEDTEIFTISDLSSLWALITVYPKYLSYVDRGREVILKFSNGIKEIKGKIDFISPVVGEETRTSTARVVINNPEFRYKPGMFFTALIIVPDKMAELCIPKSAVQEIDGEKYVFVKKENFFEPRKVVLGVSNHAYTEIVKGVEKGELVVVKGSFVLKAQMTKDTFEEGHSH